MSHLFGLIGALTQSLGALIFLLMQPAHRFASLRIGLITASLLCGIEIGFAFSDGLIPVIGCLVIAAMLLIWGGTRIINKAPKLDKRKERWKFTGLCLGLMSGIAWTISGLIQLSG